MMTLFGLLFGGGALGFLLWTVAPQIAARIFTALLDAALFVIATLAQWLFKGSEWISKDRYAVFTLLFAVSVAAHVGPRIDPWQWLERSDVESATRSAPAPRKPTAARRVIDRVVTKGARTRAEPTPRASDDLHCKLAPMSC